MNLKTLTKFLMLCMVGFGLACCSSDDEPEVPVNPDPTPTPTKTEYMKLVSSSAHDMTISALSTDEYSYIINTTGTDPYIYVEGLKSALPEDSCVLTFEYRADKATDLTQLFFGKTISESRSVKTDGLSVAATWKTFSLIIKTERTNFSWGKAGDNLRLDFGNTSGANLYVRHIYVRSMTASEKAAWDAEEQAAKDRETMAANVKKYLETTYASKVTNVNVTSDKVTITGTVSSSGSFALAEVMPNEEVTELKTFDNQTAISGNSFTITLDRVVARKEGAYNFQYDRLLSRWAIINKTSSGDVLASHARYADEVAAKSSPTAMTLKNKKGIGAYSSSASHAGDLDDLGLGSVTINMTVNNLISTQQWSSNNITHRFNGITYYINGTTLNSYDRTISECTRKGVITLPIVLITPGSTSSVMTEIFRDPEYTEGYFTMPNMTTLRSVTAFAAIIDFLAQRYNGGNYGRLNHWIMLNEVDFGKEWSNMGDQPEMRYMDRYVKVMRLVYNIVRQYDQNSAVLGSYTHCWTQADGGTGYAPKTMLEQTQQYCNAEGDFWWGAAVHPYPQDLTAPAFWRNDTRSTYSLNSGYVTFKNLEVYDAFFKQSSMKYTGGVKRLVFLSENGTNSPDYSTSNLTLQAAGACWAWKKVAKLDGIDAMQWHNWQDNPAEYGLRIGLRYFESDATYKGAGKPVWYVWQAAGTSTEDEVFKPYMSTLGITSWESIHHSVQ